RALDVRLRDLSAHGFGLDVPRELECSQVETLETRAGFAGALLVFFGQRMAQAAGTRVADDDENFDLRRAPGRGIEQEHRSTRQLIGSRRNGDRYGRRAQSTHVMRAGAALFPRRR